MFTKHISSCGLIAILVVACSSDHASEGTDGGSGGASKGDAETGGKKMDGGGTGGHTGSGGSTGSSGSGGTSSDAGATAPMTGVVVDNTKFPTEKSFDETKYPGVSGVKVCVYEDSTVPCATTDSSGNYTIDLPVGRLSYVSYEKSGYTSMLYGVTPSSNAAVASPAVFMPTTSYSDSFLMKAGVTNDPKQGGILFGAVELGPSSAPTHQLFGTTELFYLSGYTVTLSPAATNGPVFTGDDWEPDPSLKKSSTAGWGFFAAKPGDYTLTITMPGYTCPSTTTKVVAAYDTTLVGALCTPAPSDAGIADAATD